MSTSSSLTLDISSTSHKVEPSPEHLYTLKQLTEAGYGARPSLIRQIQDGVLPAYRVSGYLRVRESDLSLLVGQRVDPAEVLG